MNEEIKTIEEVQEELRYFKLKLIETVEIFELKLLEMKDREYKKIDDELNAMESILKIPLSNEK